MRRRGLAYRSSTLCSFLPAAAAAPVRPASLSAAFSLTGSAVAGHATPKAHIPRVRHLGPFPIPPYLLSDLAQRFARKQPSRSRLKSASCDLPVPDWFLCGTSKSQDRSGDGSPGYVRSPAGPVSAQPSAAQSRPLRLAGWQETGFSGGSGPGGVFQQSLDHSLRPRPNGC